MKSVFKIAHLVLFIVTISLNTFSQNADEILEDLSTKTNSYKNIKASFAYKMVNTELDINEVTNGTLMVEGEKYNLNIAGQIVISNGATLWTYIPDSEEVQINEVSEDIGFSPNKLLSSYNEEYNAKMMDDISREGVSFYQLKLKPKNENSNFDYVILVINKEKIQLVDFIIYDFDGNIFSYEIKQFVTDSDIPAGSFKFDEAAHPNVEVIDMR